MSVSGVKDRVVSRRIPRRNVGVSLSHLNLLSVTFNNSPPARSHVREYVCPSIGDPVGVMSSVKGGTIMIIKCVTIKHQFTEKGTCHGYDKTITPDNSATPHCLTRILSIARRCSLPERSEGEGG